MCQGSAFVGGRALAAGRRPLRATHMEPVLTPPSPAQFVDRRRGQTEGVIPSRERRQFGNTYSGLSTPARELGETIDQYKLVHRRRFITYEELLSVIESLGYHK